MSNGQDPQNPFTQVTQVTQTDSTVESKFDPQNPFALRPTESLVEPAEATVGELALSGAKGLGSLALGVLAFPFEILTGGRGLIPPTLEELEESRKELLAAKGGPGFEHVKIERLLQLHDEIESARQRRKTEQAVSRARELRGREIGGLPEEDFRGKLRRIFGVREVSGIVEPPKTRAEAALAGILGLPGHLIAAFEQAPTQEAQAEAISTAVGVVGLFAAPFVGGRAASVAPQEVAARIAQQRVLAVTERPVPMREAALPIRGEQAAIRERLVAEETADISALILDAHRRTNTHGVTIIPGVERITPELLKRVKDVSVDHHVRPDGRFDLAIYGKDSPLADPALSKQFNETGFFEGQEVTLNGKPYVIDELARIPRDPKKPSLGYDALLRGPDGERILSSTNHLRRTPVIEIDLPIVATIRAEPFTPLDAAELISATTEILDPVTAAARRAVTPAVFDNVISSVLGRERGEITTVPREPVTLRPGVNVVSTFDRFPEISALFDDPLPDNTAFIYAGPDGRPVGIMEVNTLFNGGFPGIGAQIIAGVEKPVFGKLTTVITGFIIDPRAHPMLQGRAAIALMEEAGRLGVTRLMAPVDEAGMRIVARFINKFIGKKQVVEKRFRVGEMSVDQDGLYTAFKQYHDGALSSDKVIERLGGRERLVTTDADGIERVNFDPLVEAFARESGFLPEEIPGLKIFLEQRLARESRELYLTPDELSLYNRVSSELRAQLGVEPRPLAVLAELPEPPLSLAASSNGFTAEWTPSGVIEIRGTDNVLLGRFNTPEGAREFINRSGQETRGADLDGGRARNDVPPGAVAGGAVPPPPAPPSNLTSGLPPNRPPDPLNVSWLPPGNRIPEIADLYATTLTYIVEYDRLFNGFDNRFGTRFSDGARALQTQLRIVDTERHPWLLRLRVADKLLKGRSRDRAALLARYVETMSSRQIASEGFFRPLNSAEINIGNLLVEMRVDLARAEEFARKVSELETLYEGDALVAQTRALVAELKLDKDHVTAGALLRRVRDMPIDEAYVGHIIRYADARMLEDLGFDLTPEGFAKANKITPQEIQAVRVLEQVGDELANIFDIPEYRRIRRWLPHFEAFSARGINPTSAFLGQRGLRAVKEIKFISDLARTGELSTIVNDPVLAMARYINAGFRDKFLNRTIESSVSLWKQELAKLPGDVRKHTEGLLTRFLEDVRGIPEASRGVVRRTTSDLLKRIGIEVSSDVAIATTNFVTAAYSLKFLAFRMMQGFRDWTSGLGAAFTRFGTARAARMYELGWRATSDQIAALHKSGAIPVEMSPIQIETPAALVTTEAAMRRAAAGALAKGAVKVSEHVNTVADLGLRASLQPAVYRRWHAGAYLEGRELALKHLNDLAFNKTTAAKVFRELDLEAYSPAFIRQFQELVNARKFEDAAHLYGQETGRMVMVTYGATYHPMGWRTVVGRLAGGYGRYPTWLANVMVELASRGSLRYRTRAWTRFWAFQGALYLTLQEGLGIDVYNWLMAPAVRWFGGPAVQLAKSTLDLLSPNDQVQARAADEITRQLSPVPLAARDIFMGLRLADDAAPDPTNPVEALLRATGSRLAEEPSLLDRFLGTD